MLAPTIVVLSLILSSSAATVDVLTQGQVMNSSQTIISNGSIFELGFFSFGLGNSRTQKRFYLGIWYKQASANSNRTIVWVANRDKPIISNYSSCFLTINNDGNLAIFDRAISIPITSLPSTTNVTATLLDSGNFVLRQNRGDGTNASSLLWQSFDYPTDTSLPGVRIEYNRKTGKTYKLTSWKSPDDPSPGHYSLLLDTERMAQFLILNGSQPLWTSGAWNGHNFRYSPEMAWTRRLYTFNYYSNGSESYFLVNNVLSNESVLLTRYVMDISGKIQQFTWVESSQSWVKYWEQPKQQCNVYSYCGSNSICDKGHYPYCKCLEGFRPQNLRDWNGGNWSSGCGRRSALQCGDQDGFLIMKNMSLPLDPKVLQLQSAADCKSSCFGTCACNAYAYSNNQCLVWHGSLFNVRQADYDGEDLLLKLPAFEIKNYEAGRADTDLDLMLFDFTTKTKPTKRELLKPRNSTVKDEIWDVELPFFSFSSICTATNNFSNANKIGQGGFGPVYKGTLQSGHVVAVKRLSARSCQGLEELKNETTLIAKLQHRNLVKLLGCCIEDERELELVDQYLIFSSSSFPTSPTKYIQLALLCVQEKPSDRPTMSEVNAMLSSDSVTLPLPKQPAFCFDRGMVLSSGEKPYSINDITVSLTAR
ncbi:hypothetical protein Sjap_015086 [Stephania japonica]|uniref:Uncharacterized protein n=1 Tax=Stephania japonica TaxID=461633 RepID=A0AAP0NS58_9MAGN